MTDDKDHHTPTPVAIEKEKTRRRLISLGELVAVLAVIISALTLANSWSERQSKERERAAEERKAAADEQRAAKASVLLLTARANSDGSLLALAPTRDGQVVQSQTLRFPAALDLSPVETSGDPRIDVDWFASALKKARRAEKRPDETVGDERLPVLIETVYVDSGETRTDRALYDIGYAVTGGGLLGGSTVRLRGISLVRHGASAAALDARWTERMRK